MENNRVIKIFLSIMGGGIAFSIPFFVIAYDDNTTHAALTQEIAEFFNHDFPDKKLSDDETKILIKGSIEEDNGTRWMHHYYDPVYNRGLVVSGTYWESSKRWSQDTLAQAEFGETLYDYAYGSIFELFSSDRDYSWERAIYDYAWEDKNRGILALGHVLHLIEDVTVPDHTRNDSHPAVYEGAHLWDSSPYESWAVFKPGKLDLAEKFIGVNKKSVILTSLNEFFDKTAIYSNNNFFSRDSTVGEYTSPTVMYTQKELLSDGFFTNFGYAELDDLKYRLLKVPTTFDWRQKLNSQDVTDLTLRDHDSLILTDYWNLLSEKAVLNGAGLVKLFFDEVDKEKQTRALWKKNRNWWQRTLDWTSGLFWSSDNSTPDYPIAMVEFGVDATGVAAVVGGLATTNPTPDYPAAVVTSGVVTKDSDSTPDDPPVAGVTSGVVGTMAPEPEFPTAPATPDYPADTVESGVATNNSTPDDPPVGVTSGVDAATTKNATTTSIVLPTPAAQPPWFLGEFVIGGGGSPPATPQDNPTTPDDPAGAVTSGVDATSTATSTPDDPSPDVTSGVDDEPPDVTLSVKECEDSFSDTECVIAAQTVTVDWGSTAQDVESYEISCESTPDDPPIGVTSGVAMWRECENFSYDPLATSTATTTPDDPPLGGVTSGVDLTRTVFNVSKNKIYRFRAKARDNAGNESEEVLQTVEINPSPVVINEVAWMGNGDTEELARDEWVEIYNRSNHVINLNKISLNFYHVFENMPEDSPVKTISLSGHLQPKNYYLIERDSDLAVSNIAADLVTSFDKNYTEEELQNMDFQMESGLSDFGMILKLQKGASVVDLTPMPVNYWWCCGHGGNIGTIRSMERIDPDGGGENASNWGNYDIGVIRSLAKNRIGTRIAGSPKERNSFNYLIAVGGTLWQDKTLTSENALYIVSRRGLTVQEGATLTVEPGVVIKIHAADMPGIQIKGRFISGGTPEDPVVITTMADDEYGGDSSRDGVCDPSNPESQAGCPNPGSWVNLILDGSDGSVLDNMIIRYGGRDFLGITPMVLVQNSEVSINGSVFEHSAGHGLFLSGFSGQVTNSVFRHNSAVAPLLQVGLVVSKGMLEITNSVFDDNNTGLAIFNSTTTISNLVFRNNHFGIKADEFSTVTNNGSIEIDDSNVIKTIPVDLLGE